MQYIFQTKHLVFMNVFTAWYYVIRSIAKEFSFMSCYKTSPNDESLENNEKFTKTRFIVITIYCNCTKNTPNIAHMKKYSWG